MTCESSPPVGCTPPAAACTTSSPGKARPRSGDTVPESARGQESRTRDPARGTGSRARALRLVFGYDYGSLCFAAGVVGSVGNFSPAGARLTLHHLQSIPTSHPDLRMTQFVPADDATRSALALS